MVQYDSFDIVTGDNKATGDNIETNENIATASNVEAGNNVMSFLNSSLVLPVQGLCKRDNSYTFSEHSPHSM